MADRLTLSPGREGSAPATGTATVTVACKLPHGIFLQLFETLTRQEAGPGGIYRDVKVPKPVGKRYEVSGYLTKGAQIVGGYALTAGIPKDHWDTWKEQQHDFEAVKNGLIFAYERPGHTEDQAKDSDHAKLRSGLEAMDMRMVRNKDDRLVAADPRVPRERGLSVEQATSADPR
jgi:hypothetical protein